MFGSKNTGNWTIKHEIGGTTRTFTSRREAADYAGRQQRLGASSMTVTTPDGRKGTLGHIDRDTHQVTGSRWLS